MKISELIDKLKDRKIVYGDHEVTLMQETKLTDKRTVQVESNLKDIAVSQRTLDKRVQATYFVLIGNEVG